MTVLISTHGNGQVQAGARGWRFVLPAGEARGYRLAQVADGADKPRTALPWRPPLTLTLRARVSEQNLPGTWGFGLWNDPFTATLGLNGMARRLPTLPQALWFFHGGAENCLTLRDDLPPNGFVAGGFASRPFPRLLLAAGLPLLTLPPLARWLRRLGRRWVAEDATALQLDETAWHTYRLEWGENEARFWVDDVQVLQTKLAPRPPLALVVWIDNQFAAFLPDGKLRAGVCANPAAWLEVDDFYIRGWNDQTL